MIYGQILWVLCFLAIIIFTCYPVKIASIKISKRLPPITFVLSIATTPVISVLLLWASQVFSFHSTILKGMLGNEMLQPWKVLVMFYTLSYLCISIEVSGILLRISRRIIDRSFSYQTPLPLLTVIFAISAILTIFTSNDIVILVLTPIICTASRGRTKLSSLEPFLIAQFFAANTWSLIFYISNPTNIIVAMTNRWSFIYYAKFMVIPAFGCGSVLFVLIYLRYRKQLKWVKPLVALNDEIDEKNGSSASSLAIIETYGKEDSVEMQAKKSQLGPPSVTLTNDSDSSAVIEMASPKPNNLQQEQITARSTQNPIDSYFGLVILLFCLILMSMCEWLIKFESWIIVAVCSGLVLLFDLYRDLNFTMFNSDSSLQKKRYSFNFLKNYFPKTNQVLRRLPFSFIPFLLGMFIMVEGLESISWMDPIATSYADFIKDKHVFAVILFTGTLSTFVSNLMNNQPMTILFSRIFSHPTFTAIVTSSSLQDANFFALAMGSNLGANLTLLGALAGMMWSKMLHFYNTNYIQDSQENNCKYEMGYIRFAKIGVLLTPPMILCGSILLFIEFVSFS